MKKITFIGLGVIGYPLAGHISKNGYDVTVFNRTVQKSNNWSKEYTGKVAESLSEACKNADILFICVGDDEDLKNVFFGDDGALNSLKKNSLVIDHTTASAAFAKEIASKLKSKDIGFLDAPVSGGGSGAINGSLSIMVGGEEKDFNRGVDIMKLYGKSINHMGKVGTGQLTKMVNQILISATLQGVAEAMKFGTKANLDMDKVLDVVSKGAAQSWQLENRADWMLTSKYKNGGFTVDLIKKDLELVLEEAEINNSKIPITKKIENYFELLQEKKLGKWDFSSLYELL